MVAVEDDQVGGHWQRRERADAGQPQRRDDPDLVDLYGRGMPHRVRVGPTTDRGDHAFAGRGGEELGVANPGGGGAAYLVNDDHAHTHRAGQGASTHLVHPGQQPVALTLQASLDAQ